MRRMLLCAVVATAGCSGSEDDADVVQRDCDGMIAPILALQDDDMWPRGKASDGRYAFAMRTKVEEPTWPPTRLVVVDGCGAEPVTLVEGAAEIESRTSRDDGPWMVRIAAEAPDEEDERWIYDPFGTLAPQRLPAGLVWLGEENDDGLIAAALGDDNEFVLSYDEYGLGEPTPFVRPPPPEPSPVLYADGDVQYVLDAGDLVARDTKTQTTTVVFEDVDSVSPVDDGQIFYLQRDVDGEPRDWAWEPKTGRVVEVPVDGAAMRGETRRAVLLWPQLRVMWLDEDLAGTWSAAVHATAPDGTALFVVDGTVYRVEPDSVEPVAIAGGLGRLVSPVYLDGAFYLEAPEPSDSSKRLYRVELDGAGVSDVFGRPVAEWIRIREDRWVFVDGAALRLLDRSDRSEEMLWPNIWGPAWQESETTVMFTGTTPDGGDKTVYELRLDQLD